MPKLKNKILVISLSVFIIYFFYYLVYSPIITLPYLYHDQLNYFNQIKNSCTDWVPYIWYKYFLVRPVALFLECFNFLHASSINNLTSLRYLTLLSVGTCAFVMSCGIIQLELKNKISLILLSLALFTLPGIQYLAFMSYTSYILGIVAAIISYSLLHFCKEISPTRPKYYFQYILSALLLFLSFFTYQPAALFFATCAIMHCLFTERNDYNSTLKVMIKDLVFFGTISFVTLISEKIINYNYLKNHPQVNSLTAYIFNFQFNIKAIALFITQLFIISANLWNLFITNLAAFFAITVLLIGLICAYVSTKPKFKQAATTVAFIILMSLLTLTPYLIHPESPLVYRILFGFMSALLFILIWATWQIMDVLKLAAFKILLPVLVLIIGAFMANQTMLNMSWSTSMDISSYLRELETFKNINQIKGMYVMIPPAYYINGKSNLLKSADEFFFYPSGFTEDIIAIANASLIQSFPNQSFRLYDCEDIGRAWQKFSACQKKAPANSIIVGYGSQPPDVLPKTGYVVIDPKLPIKSNYL